MYQNSVPATPAVLSDHFAIDAPLPAIARLFSMDRQFHPLCARPRRNQSCGPVATQSVLLARPLSNTEGPARIHAVAKRRRFNARSRGRNES